MNIFVILDPQIRNAYKNEVEISQIKSTKNSEVKIRSSKGFRITIEIGIEVVDHVTMKEVRLIIKIIIFHEIKEILIKNVMEINRILCLHYLSVVGFIRLEKLVLPISLSVLYVSKICFFIKGFFSSKIWFMFEFELRVSELPFMKLGNLYNTALVLLPNANEWCFILLLVFSLDWICIWTFGSLALYLLHKEVVCIIDHGEMLLYNQIFVNDYG